MRNIVIILCVTLLSCGKPKPDYCHDISQVLLEYENHCLDELVVQIYSGAEWIKKHGIPEDRLDKGREPLLPPPSYGYDVIYASFIDTLRTKAYDFDLSQFQDQDKSTWRWRCINQREGCPKISISKPFHSYNGHHLLIFLTTNTEGRRYVYEKTKNGNWKI